MASIRPEDLAKHLKDKVDQASEKTKKAWAAAGAPILKELINEFLDEGKSPAAGEGQFPAYAKSTKERKRAKGQQTSPVNMTDTGRLRQSLTVQARGSSIIAFFSGGRNSELFKIHALLADKIRMMLPTGPVTAYHKTIKDALSELFVKLYKIIK